MACINLSGDGSAVVFFWLGFLALCLRGFLGYKAISFIIPVLQYLPISGPTFFQVFILQHWGGNQGPAEPSATKLQSTCFFSMIFWGRLLLYPKLAFSSAHTYCSWDESHSWAPVHSRTSVTLPDSHRPQKLNVVWRMPLFLAVRWLVLCLSLKDKAKCGHLAIPWETFWPLSVLV